MLFFLLDIVAPKRCYSCSKEGHFLCPECYKKVKDFENICYVCKNLSKNFLVHDSCKTGIYYDKILILKHYQSENFGNIIKQGKFYGVTGVFDELVLRMKDLLLENQKIRKYDDFVIVSVPSPFRRRLKRGYNSSEILAKKFAKIIPISYKNIIKKKKYSKQQSKLSREERLTNLDNSFTIRRKKEVFGKKIIIVDDVISTGSTINEVSRVLKENGAKEVIGLCLASN